jgi:hypothetical protein
MKRYSRSSNLNIIKKKNVKVSGSHKVDHSNMKLEPLNNTAITPIKENDQVVGFVFQCSCGETAKVMLEFDEP